MNRSYKLYRSKIGGQRQASSHWMLATAALSLCMVAMAFPLATACARGTAWDVARQDGDGYGITWYADPGEWYVAPHAPAVDASKPQSLDDGYGVAWFADPGEWYVVPDTAVARASTPLHADNGYGSTWFADPGEWYVAPGGPLAFTSQAESDTD